MRRRSKRLPALLLGSALLASTLGIGAVATAADPQAAAGGTGVHSGHTMAVSTQASADDPDGDGYIPAVPQVTGVKPSDATPPNRYHKEFQANCAVTHTAPDDPIVYPGQPGRSHDHTFMGNRTTHAGSTTDSLYGGNTTCKAPADASAYWMPSLYKGNEKILPVGPQVIYYKSGITDYTSVRPFPKGLRYVVGNPMQSAQDFRSHKGFVEGWECGDSFFNTDFPASCPSRPDVQLNIRFQAPSCWDGKYLDTPDHQSHMAYPVVKPGTNDNMCPASHPVALPMIEFKMAWPVNGDMSDVRLASGRGYSFHYDFFNAWEERTLKALVDRCIVGGYQCDTRGYDQNYPHLAPVLNEDHRLP
ncbi:DUF1996 domain-containing protein [Streptomyces indicus]|uniref:DUF1996 domain-containing protein n=1 Tax=Streptomyces indicus TaxID=417292 RepID=A0A1G9GLP7_9ACTN|nr:DUF1996 domain-containing protein [Streptomyces indicus]SDL01584.1 protein of unknown function [Streptomyces indicus]